MLILILAAFLVLLPRVAHSDCVDYHNFHSSVVGSVDTPGAAYDVAVSGAFAYVADNTSGLQVINLSDPASPSIVGSVPGSPTRVAVSGNFAYASDVSGVHVIDVSNPSSPSIVSTINAHGDVAVSGTYAYVAGSNLLVIDVSNPASPVTVGSVNAPGGFGIAVSGAIVYVVAHPFNPQGRLTLVDVTNPASPVIRGTVSLPHPADEVAVSGTMAYVACYGWGIYVIDASNPNSPVVRSHVDTPGASTGVAISGMVAYVADRTSGIQVIDVSNPVSPVVLGSLNVPDAQSLVVAGTFAYVAGIATGFHVLDASNPGPPMYLGVYSPPGPLLGVTVSGHIAYLTGSGQSQIGLALMDISNPASPSILTNFTGAGGAVTVSGTRAYVVGQDLRIYDVAAPVLLGTAPYGGEAVAVSGTMAYVTTSLLPAPYASFWAIDVSNPASPVLLGSLANGGSDIELNGTVAYVVGSRPVGTFQMIDVSNPAAPVLVGTVPGGGNSIALLGAVAYVGTNTGINVFGVSNPASPVLLSSVATPSTPVDVAVSERTVYADMDPGLLAIDVTDPTTPEILGVNPVGSGTQAMAASETAVCLVGIAGLIIAPPAKCPNAAPSIQDPGNRNGIELKYFSLTVTATDSEGDPLTMSLVGPAPAWATFSDLGSGTALLKGTPQSGQAGTYPISIRSSDGLAADTTSFNIVVAPALTTVNLGSSGFVPGNATILAGAQVKWVKIAGGNHTTTNGTGPLDPAAGTLWDAQLRATSPEFTRVFPTAGTFPYFCRNHPSETGTITVGSAQTGIDESVSPKLRLLGSPNPFRGGVDLEFELDRSERANVVILDIQGRKVRDLVTGEFPAGTHRASWEGRDDNRALVGSGLYFARLVTGDGHVLVQKLFKIR